MTDSEFRKDVEESGFEVSYRSGEDLATRVAATMETPTVVVELAQNAATLK